MMLYVAIVFCVLYSSNKEEWLCQLLGGKIINQSINQSINQASKQETGPLVMSQKADQYTLIEQSNILLKQSG